MADSVLDAIEEPKSVFDPEIVEPDIPSARAAYPLLEWSFVNTSQQIACGRTVRHHDLIGVHLHL
jgi:hypothetical protein